MGIASLINVPKTQNEWNAWSLNHKIQHDNINRAILLKKGKTLTGYVIDPIDLQSPDIFLQNNAQIHTDVCSVLNVSGSDLFEINWQDKKQVENWIYLHWQEHSSFNTALGL